MTQAARLDCCCLQYQKKKIVTLVTQAARLDCCCLQYQKKKIVTGRDVAATWHIAFCNDLRRTHCTNSVGSGDQSVPKALSCLAARLPLSGFKPEGYSSNSQLTHTLTSRALLGIVLRIRTAGARRIALARAYQRLLRALPVTPMV